MRVGRPIEWILASDDPRRYPMNGSKQQKGVGVEPTNGLIASRSPMSSVRSLAAANE